MLPSAARDRAGFGADGLDGLEEAIPLDEEEDIDPVDCTDENEDIENSRIKFYDAIESNCDKYIPPNARGKFPVKTKIAKPQNLTNTRRKAKNQPRN